MTDISDLMKRIPVADIAQQLGISESEASSAVSTALPGLVKGLQANATDPAGASSLLDALKGKDPSLAQGSISLSDIDISDGAKIVKNVFGSNQDQVAAKLGGGKSDIMSQLLPILAPIVLSWVASKVLGGGSSSSSKGGGLGDLLGGLFGGGSSSGSKKSKKNQPDLAGGLADALGGLLGGDSGGFGLDDVLGGLLGGGKR